MPAPGITVLKHNVPWGPFTRAQIDDGIARGDFTVKYLAHTPGLNEWLPLGEVLDYVARHESSAVPVLPPVPESREYPSLPQVTVPLPASILAPAPVLPPAPMVRPPILPAVPPKEPASAAPKPQVPPFATVPATRLTPAPELVAGSFFLRSIAFLVDCGILFIPAVVLFILGALSIEIPTWFRHTNAQTLSDQWALLRINMWRMSGLLAIGCAWFYSAGFEASRSQATIGKRWMGLKVTDAHGERLSFLHASGRYGAKYVSAIPCFLGFMVALFSSRGLALHDRLAGTRVVRAEEK
jgi:uncharacterized RDD family membrane protein YckC